MSLDDAIKQFIEANHIDGLVAEQLGYYVYGIYATAEQTPFYVGKGSGTRVPDHFEAALREEQDSDKLKTIRESFVGDEQLAIRILWRGIADEKSAYEIESSLIDALSPRVNKVLGHDADPTRGRAPLVSGGLCRAGRSHGDARGRRLRRRRTSA